MTVQRVRSPGRMRRRLTVMCIVLAGLSAGFLALTSFFVVRDQRYRRFEDQAVRKVELASLFLPGSTTGPSELTQALAEYGQRGGFDAIAIKGDSVRSSTPSLDTTAIPARLRDDPDAASRGLTTQVAGRETLVIGRLGSDGETRLYFFFSTDDLHASISVLRNVLAGAWVLTVVLGALAGAWIARRMLRPVRDAAIAARALAVRLLGDEPAPGIDDEFEIWVESYNELAAALEAKIAALSNAADRERQFTSDVAHELRTPLTALSSAAAVLEHRLDELPVSTRRPVELLIGDVRRMQALVLELLELARLDAGSDAPHPELLHLEPAIRAVVRSQPGSENVSCAVDPDLCVSADRAHFKRVMANLIDNAIRHGRGTCVVRARRSGDVAEIDVMDDGPGVPPEDADRIFGRFYKADAGRAHGGSGLGLAIALEHARAAGGSLMLANPGRQGAQFTFTLPIAAEVSPEASALERPRRAGPSPLRGHRD